MNMKAAHRLTRTCKLEDKRQQNDYRIISDDLKGMKMKPVVIGQLFPFSYIPLCEDDYVFISINTDDSRVAIWLHKSQTKKCLVFEDATSIEYKQL